MTGSTHRDTCAYKGQVTRLDFGPVPDRISRTCFGRRGHSFPCGTGTDSRTPLEQLKRWWTLKTSRTQLVYGYRVGTFLTFTLLTLGSVNWIVIYMKFHVNFRGIRK